MTQITSPLAKRLNQYLTGLLSSSGDKTRRRGGEKNLIFTPLKISGAHLPYPDQFLDIPIDFEGISPFGRRVLEQCRRIRPGKTKSYGELAKLAGNSGGARAVGNWMARNRVPTYNSLPPSSLRGWSDRQLFCTGWGGSEKITIKLRKTIPIKKVFYLIKPPHRIIFFKNETRQHLAIV